jgi:hypothetical protein
MKQNRPFLIQILVAVVLIASWFMYENQREDRNEYFDVLSDTHSNRRATELIVSSSNNLIRNAEGMALENPTQKPLVGIMKEMESVISDYYGFIENIKNDFFEYNEEDSHPFRRDIDWKPAKPRIIMPIAYNSTEPVKRIFKEKKAFDNFEKKWQETLDKLKILCSKSVRESMDIETLSDSMLNNYYQKQLFSIQENTPVHQKLIEKKELHNTILKYDVVHAASLLTALQSELKSLEWILLQNSLRLMKEEKNKLATMIMMNTQGMPQVGKPTSLEFYLAAYLTTDNMEIRLNGKPFEVKNGVATFNYTPQSAGMNYFRVEVSVKNPLTGAIDSFFKLHEVEVFE